jgi:hypothetical protein
MANTILIKRSSTANTVPSAASLAQGELAINLTDGNLFYKNASDQVTVIASNKFLSVTGNVTGANITGAHFGSGAGLSSLTGANVTGTVPAATTATTAGTVTTAAQGNITSVGTLTSLSVSGNVVGGNINTAGNVTGAFILGNGSLLTGLPATYSNSNVVTLLAAFGSNTISTTGNITSGNFVGTLNGSGANVTSINATNISSGTLAQARLANAAVTLGSTALTLGATVTTVAGLSSVTSTTFVGALTGAATTAGTVTTNAQPNITSVGTLSALSVSGNIVGANLNGAHFGSGAGLSSITGANVTGTVPAATTAGTVTTNAQPNITSVGTLSALSVSGNVTGGNVTTNTVAGTGLTLRSSGSLNLSATGNVVVNNVVINGLAAPAQDADAATKGYVDSVAQGLDVKASVVFATTAALPAFTYNNGASGVGATITANANGALSIDGSAPAAGNRVLIKNETSTNQPFNGIYVVTNAGAVGAAFVLTRATDFDSGSPSGEIPGAFTFVEQGATQADTGFVCTTNAPVTVGTTNIVWAQFSGAGTYAAGTGLTLTGSTFSVNASQTQITAVGTLGSLAVTGTATAGNLSTGGTVSAAGNVRGGNLTTGGVVSATGAITGAAITGTSLTVSTGNITGGNLILSGAIIDSAQLDIQTSAANANIVLTPNGTGNVNIGRMSASGNITAAAYFGSGAGLSSITGANVTGTVPAATTAGTVTTAAQGNITSVGTLTSLAVTGNITGGNIATVGTGTIATLTVGTFANITATTGATSAVTGALRVAGGAGIVGNIYGGAVYSGGALALTVDSTVDGGTY